MKENEKLIYDTRKAELDQMLGALISDETVYNDDGMLIGNISAIKVLERKTREGQPYNQIELCVRSTDGKTFTKRWSVDFTRKFLQQVGVKAEEIEGAVVIFKQKDNFRNIGFFAFVIAISDENGEVGLDIRRYIDEGTDFKDALKKLGL